MASSSEPVLKPGSSLFSSLLNPFRVKGKLNSPLLLVFLCINVLVLINAVLHPPLIGYDAADHLAYAETLATKGLPSSDDTLEYFSAPLPYLLPAMLLRWTPLNLIQAAKIAQMGNVLLSVATCIYLLEICRLLAPDTPVVRLGALGVLAVLTVYYKTFAFVRGEPYVVFFAVVIVYFAYLTFVKRTLKITHSLALGTALGLACLARQWGFLLVSGLGLYGVVAAVQDKPSRARIAGLLSTAFLLALAICGWFYLSLYVRYGSIAAFNREANTRFALSNQPRHFYTELGLPDLFTDPVRGHFANALLPTLYADTWGDYWGYLIVYGKDLRTGRWLDGSEWSREVALPSPPSWFATNRYAVSRFLGRVQLLSLFPSLLMVASVAYGVVRALRRVAGRESGTETNMARLLLSIVATCLGGYLGFLIMFPSPGKGDTIKATYLLHTFPLVAILVGLALNWLATRSRGLYVSILVGLAVVFAHNLPAYVTRYSDVSSTLFSDTRIVLESPAPRSRVHTPVEIQGTVRSAGMQGYSLWVGHGTDPAEWVWISGPHTAPVENHLLTDVSLTALAPGSYVLRVTVEFPDRQVAERYIPFTVLPQKASHNAPSEP